ncbi:DUF7718 family protein [Natrinema soli]|uniref:DUF7718 domain-containing protein n=1 Tax=Natrinema soli TaxID=1930624 RepID=A0ABD5SI04_9EURY|nr:hypothetical protein [Natrinema soli]
MTQEYGYKLGSFLGYEFSLRVSASPSLDVVDDFAVTVYYSLSSGESKAIARVDNAHGFVHFDRIYRRDQPKDPVDWTWQKAEGELRENWRQYAKSYDDAHGL